MSAKILIVDDNLENIQLLANALSFSDYNIEYATNGNDALRLIKEFNFDLILLDIMMPEIDGFETCKQIKEIPDKKNIPIIFITAKTDTESIVKGFNIGAQDYITKPINLSELIARVKTHLELKYSKEKLIKSEKKLKELNATKDKFFSIISHELKNPFAGLISISEILMKIDKNDVKEVSRFSSMLNKLITHLYKLLENLLEWSRLQTGNMKVMFTDCDLVTIINDNIALHESMTTKKKISLDFKPYKNSIIMLGDEQLLNTIFRNLISNAIKFTPKKGSVTISTKKLDEHVEISVKDSGIGIKKDDIPKLLDISEYHTTTGTDKEKGTGLGLILCKELIEKNNGELIIESKKGKGSIFTVKLPISSTLT